MLVGLFPKACSRLRIFLCHAHADRAVAEEIAQALKNDGHTVFFDKESLPAASDYNEQIRRAIARSDRFIFLISRNALAEGKYTLSELAFARERWPNAEGVIFPVLIDRGTEIEKIPTYLRSVHILQVEGNAPVEVVAAIDKSRKVSTKCVLGAASLGLSFAAALVLFVLKGGPLFPDPGFELLKPAQVDFRPMVRPAAGDAWLESNVAVTIIPVQYSNKSGRSVRIHNETVQLEIDDTKWPFRWFNEVAMNPKSIEQDWLGYKRGVGAETLDPGRTLQRETMYILEGSGKLLWRSFLSKVFDPSQDTLTVVLASKAETTIFGQVAVKDLQVPCVINLDEVRASLEASGFRADRAPHVPRVSPFCK